MARTLVKGISGKCQRNPAPHKDLCTWHMNRLPYGRVDDDRVQEEARQSAPMQSSSTSSAPMDRQV
eukprot:9693113-Karenia_brevis.AAC.1